MSFPGAILMGAQQRLLPVSVPYRFFLAACFFHLAAWILLALSADQVSGYLGGPGPLLAVLHAVTLGVFAMAALGASYQMLPVATGRALRTLWPARLSSWLYIPGVLALLHGFFWGQVLAMAVGGALIAAGLVLFAVMVGDVLNRTQGVLIVLRGFAWAALVALAGLVLLGLLAVADFQAGILADRQAVGLAHLLLAIFGFMGLLALGYSHVLVPMFALSPAPSETAGLACLSLAVLGLMLGVLGALFDQAGILGLAVVAGLVSAAIYLDTMRLSLKDGMRKNLGLSFVLVKAAWALLPLCLLAGGAAVLGIGDGRTVLLFGFLAVFGWLLTFLLGLMQRIIPFLAAMNVSGGGMPRLSELAKENPLKVHAVCHFAALALVAGGILFDIAWPVQAGAAVGAIGAASYLWFAVAVLRRLMTSLKKKENEVSHVSTDNAHPANPA